MQHLTGSVHSIGECAQNLYRYTMKTKNVAECSILLHKPNRTTPANALVAILSCSIQAFVLLSCSLTLFCPRRRRNVTVKIKCCTAIKLLLFYRISSILPQSIRRVLSAHHSLRFSAFVPVLWMGSIFMF